MKRGIMKKTVMAGLTLAAVGILAFPAYADSGNLMTSYSSSAGTDMIQAGSSFSEGKAFACVNKNGRKIYAYINKKGEVLFELPSGFIYGDEFHEGYAVITDWNYGKGVERDVFKHTYALINEKGRIVIEPGIYNFIGRVSDGASFTFSCKKDYNGNTMETKFITPENKELFRIDPSLIVEDYDEHPEHANYYVHNIKNTYFIDGLVSLQGVNKAAGSGDILVYDKQGKQTFFFEWLGDKENARGKWDMPYGSVKTNYFYRAKRKSSGGSMFIYDRKNNIINEYPLGEEAEINQETMSGGYVLGYLKDGVYKKGLVVYDYQGKRVSENKDLQVEGIRMTDDHYWVLELQNGYYGIVDETLQLLFDPIQEKIYYIGEGKFYCGSSGRVIDASGKTQFTTPYDLSPGYWGYQYESDWKHQIYKNGFMIVEDRNDNLYMNDKGVILK